MEVGGWEDNEVRGRREERGEWKNFINIKTIFDDDHLKDNSLSGMGSFMYFTQASRKILIIPRTTARSMMTLHFRNLKFKNISNINPQSCNNLIKIMWKNRKFDRF